MRKPSLPLLVILSNAKNLVNALMQDASLSFAHYYLKRSFDALTLAQDDNKVRKPSLTLGQEDNKVRKPSLTLGQDDNAEK